MQTMRFINNETGAEFLLDRVLGKPYFLKDVVGLSDVPVDLISVRGYHQDGQTAQGQYLQARSVSFSVYVFGNSYDEVTARRRTLLHALNPKNTYLVYYNNGIKEYRFSCRISVGGSFPTVDERGLGYTQICTVSINLDDPYLYDAEDTEVAMSVEEALFSFPFSLPASGFSFSSLIGSNVVLFNGGDVPTPVRIQFLGGTVDPIITNETTGEFIKVIKSIGADEILEITTGYGNKKVEIIDDAGARTNAFQYIDTDSVFFDLVVGENIITFAAGSGGESADVVIYFSNKYVGV